MTDLFGELIARELSRTPVTAARLGAEATGAALPDMSDTGIRASESEDRRWIERLSAVDPPDEEERFDRDLAVLGLRHRLVLHELRMHRRSPELYTTPVLAALRLGVDQPAYLEQAPEMLRHGRRNLDPELTDPQLLVRAAAQARAGAAVCERLGGEEAAAAYAEFADFLTSLAEKAHGDPAVDEPAYTALVRLAAGDGYDAGSVHELGLARVRELKSRLTTLPVLTDQPAHDAGELLEWYRAETERARRFCAEHDLVTLPHDEACEVIAAPADKLALLPVASYEPPPLLAGSGPGRFLVPPTPQRRSGLATVTVHETYPGHHAHYSRMSRRPIRALFTSPFLTEGWGVYAEQLAGELGYYTGPGELRGHLVALLVRAARAAIDAGLHTGVMTVEAARAYLTDELRLPEQYADAEVSRCLAYPTQAAAYLIGATEIAAVVAAAGGPAAGIHDRLTALGAPPLPLARRSVL